MRSVRLLAVAVLAVVLAAPFAYALTPHQIAMNVAIDKGIQYLNTLQLPSGSIGGSYPVGATALYLIALLEKQVPHADTHVQGALNYLLSFVQPDGSISDGTEMCYTTAGVVMALVEYNDPAYLQTIKNAANYLLQCQVSAGPYAGSFGYSAGYNSGDLSNTQFAILGLKAAELAGWSPPSTTPYQNLANWVKTQQNADGGYCAYGYASSSGAGTAAALIALALTGVPEDDPSVQGGIKWLHDYFSYTTNPGYDWLGAYYYYLYGAMKALTFLGVTNEVGGVMDPTTVTNPGNPSDRGWYFDFTEYLVETQLANGDWPGFPGWFGGHTLEDIFAVLVLREQQSYPHNLHSPLRSAASWNL